MYIDAKTGTGETPAGNLIGASQPVGCRRFLIQIPRENFLPLLAPRFPDVSPRHIYRHNLS